MKSESTIELLTGLIDEEIKWCNENPASDLHQDFQDGFKKGLEQAKNMISGCEEIVDDLIEDECADAIAEEQEESQKYEQNQVLIHCDCGAIIEANDNEYLEPQIFQCACGANYEVRKFTPISL